MADAAQQAWLARLHGVAERWLALPPPPEPSSASADQPAFAPSSAPANVLPVRRASTGPKRITPVAAAPAPAPLAPALTDFGEFPALTARPPARRGRDAATAAMLANKPAPVALPARLVTGGGPSTPTASSTAPRPRLPGPSPREVTDVDALQREAQSLAAWLRAGRARTLPELHLLVRLLLLPPHVAQPTGDGGPLAGSVDNMVYFAAQALLGSAQVLVPALGDNAVRLLSKCERMQAFASEFEAAVGQAPLAPSAGRRAPSVQHVYDAWGSAAGEAMQLSEHRQMFFTASEKIKDHVANLRNIWELGPNAHEFAKSVRQDLRLFLSNPRLFAKVLCQMLLGLGSSPSMVDELSKSNPGRATALDTRLGGAQKNNRIASEDFFVSLLTTADSHVLTSKQNK